MKKIVYIVLSFLMVCCLFGCDDLSTTGKAYDSDDCVEKSLMGS